MEALANVVVGSAAGDRFETGGPGRAPPVIGRFAVTGTLGCTLCRFAAVGVGGRNNWFDTVEDDSVGLYCWCLK